MSDHPTWTAEGIRALGVQTDLPTASAILGISRTHGYELHRLGRFPVPVIAIGRRLVVPVHPLLTLLGLPHQESEAS